MLFRSGQFSMLLLTDFGYLSGTNVRVLRGPVTGTSSNLADLVHFVQFCVLLLTKFKYGAIRTFRDLWRPLEGPRQSSQIWSILASFPCYYSLILGPEAIRMFHELRELATGSSSKLADLVNSGQFSMLLLTDFGSWGDTNVQGTLGSGYGDLVTTRRFYTFWPVFHAITH